MSCVLRLERTCFGEYVVYNGKDTDTETETEEDDETGPWKVPHYVEVFVDEGDVDMIRMLRVLHKNGYDGVLIPDHTPQMSCAAPWHAGMAYAIGWMRAALAGL